MSIQANFPALKPTLLLDFANVKALDPRITFTRASEGRYYDGKTFSKAEENLLTYSQAFDVAWTDTSVTTTDNNSAAPDGTTTASLLQASGAAARVGLSRIPALTSGVDYAISFFAKAGTHDIIQVAGISGLFSGNGQANFDLTNGVLGTVSGGTATITSVGNGWYRCTWVAESSGTSGNLYLTLINTTTAGRFDSTGIVSGDNVYLWGAQLEQRSSVTAYTATTTQPITNYIPVLMTAANGVARFDHNPVTEESLGLLIEEQRTNLLTYSQEFDNAAWGKTRSSITANTIVAPDGTLTGDKLVEDTTASNSHFIDRSFTFTAAAHTQSIYAKAGERSWIRLSFSDGTSTFGAYFNLSAGTVGTLTANTTASVQSVGNGWYRCAVTATAAAGTGTVRVWLASADNTNSYTGDGYSGIYIWGAQLEAGAFPTSYIPTVAAQVTRSADAASMTGTNFSSWYRADEGTLYADVIVPSLVNGQMFASFDTDVSNRMTFSNSNGSGFWFVRESNTTQAGITEGTLTANTSFKGAATYKFNDFNLSANGTVDAGDTSGVVPVVTTFYLGRYSSTTAPSYLNGCIRKIAFYPARVTNAQLQALTS